MIFKQWSYGSLSMQSPFLSYSCSLTSITSPFSALYFVTWTTFWVYIIPNCQVARRGITVVALSDTHTRPWPSCPPPLPHAGEIVDGAKFWRSGPRRAGLGRSKSKVTELRCNSFCWLGTSLGQIIQSSKVFPHPSGWGC